MIIGGISAFLMTDWDQSMSRSQSMKDAMMSSWWQLIIPQSYLSIMWAMALVTVLTGIIVAVGAYKIHKEPEKIRRWGFLILGASIVGIFCASGFGLGGAILGIIAGASSIKKDAGKHSKKIN